MNEFEINGIKLLKVPHNIAEYYRTQTKDNENETLLNIRKKLTRNYHMGKKNINQNPETNTTLCKYGNLVMLVTDDGMVVWMRNYTKEQAKGKKTKFDKDINTYNEWNEKLGIAG